MERKNEVKPTKTITVSPEIINHWNWGFTGFLKTGREVMSDEDYINLIEAYIKNRISQKSSLHKELSYLTEQVWLWGKKVFPKFKPILQKAYEVYISHLIQDNIITDGKTAEKSKVKHKPTVNLDIADNKAIQELLKKVEKIYYDRKINDIVSDLNAGRATFIKGPFGASMLVFVDSNNYFK